MADTSAPETPVTAPDGYTKPRVTTKTIIHEYLLERLPVYGELRELQRQVVLGRSLFLNYP